MEKCNEASDTSSDYDFEIDFDDDLERSAAIGATQQEFEGRLSESVANLSSYVARTCSPAPN